MLKNFRPMALLLLFALSAAAQPPAQDWTVVKALGTGTSVRVSAGSRTVSGQLQGVTDDSIEIDSGKTQTTFKRQEVTRVAVKKEGHRGRNALIGLGTGAAVGAAAGAASHKNCTGFCIFYTTRAQDAGIGAVVLGVVGALVGALIPTGGWHEVYKQLPSTFARSGQVCCLTLDWPGTGKRLGSDCV